MKICKKLVMLATAAACLAGTLPAQASPTALFEITVGQIATIAVPQIVGNRFTMSKTGTASALGLYDFGRDGFVQSNTVGLWNAGTGALLASVNFGPAQAGVAGPGATMPEWVSSTGVMRYLDIPDIVLEAGQSYWLAALIRRENGLSDQWVSGAGLSAPSDYATGFEAGWSVSKTLAIPALYTSGSGTPLAFGVNLLFSAVGDTGNTVPEPASLIQVLTLLGALALVRRRRA